MSFIRKVSSTAALSIHYSHPHCMDFLADAVHGFLNTLNPDFDRDVIYLCIGTDRATGDCLGPLVGTLLRNRRPDLKVFGDLEFPSHAINLSETIREIALLYLNPLIVAIDASLGSENRIGYISVLPGGLSPGSALQKRLPVIGDLHVTAVVNVGGHLEQMVLQNTRLFLVYRMAALIAQGLYNAHTLHFKNNSAGPFLQNSDCRRVAPAGVSSSQAQLLSSNGLDVV